MYSQLRPFSKLATQEKSLRVLPLPADLEGSEVLVPKSVRSLRLPFAPQFQLIEVFDCDVPPAKSLKQVIAWSQREIRPLNFRHLFPERQAG
jgi:hypothetical protein